MAGHSKWANIKRRKGAQDAARGKVFTRLAREIEIAARSGPDPEANFGLRLAVDRARAQNMPKDNIDRAIRRGAGLDKDASVIEEVTYEGYGPHGVALLIECLTDNRNRTLADVRRALNRANGSLGEPNSVAWQFTSMGYFLFNLEDDEGNSREIDADELFMAALEAGAEDVETGEDAIEVYCERNSFAQVLQALDGEGYKADEARLTMKPNTPLELSLDEATSVLNLVEALDELDDVNQVYHNLELTDEMVAQFA